MRTSIILLCLGISLAQSLNAGDNQMSSDSVEVINDFNNLYRYQNFYLAGQPTLEALLWLKGQGVTKIINLRTEKENDRYTGYAYNEKNKVEELGFKYYSIPISGTKDYTPEKLFELTELLSDNEKILIHCQGAGRVTHLFMAYLVDTKGYSLNDAIEVGKKINYSVPLEKLLDKEFTTQIK